MGAVINLTSRVLSKISSGKYTENDDLKPVVQVSYINRSRVYTIDNKQWYLVGLSDGSFWQMGLIAEEIIISNKLQKGDIFQLTQFQLCNHLGKSYICVCDLNLLRSKCDIIGDPKQLPCYETPIVMGVNLTSGAIAKLMTGKCTENDLQPVLQVYYINSRVICSSYGKQWHFVWLSDGSFWQSILIVDEIFISNKLQEGSILQLTNFELHKLKDESTSFICVSNLNLLHSKCGIIGHPKPLPVNETPLVERTTPTIRDKDHAKSHQVEEPPTSIQNPSTSTQKCSSHSPTSKQKQDQHDPGLNENIDDSRHVEEPPTSKQKPSASIQECSFHSLNQNKTNTLIGVNLTPGAITKVMTDKCSSTDLKPVVLVTDILSGRISTKNDKQCYRKVVLSDGSSSHFGCIADDIFISKKLQKGSIVQLTKFHFTKYCGNIRVLLIDDLNVIHSKCDIIVNPEPFPCNDIPLLERSTLPITVDDHVDVSQAQEHVTSTQNGSETQSKKRKDQSSNETPEPDTNDDVHNSQTAQEPSATTQKCSSHSLTRSKKRKHQSSNDNITKVVEDVSKMTKMVIEKNRQDDIGACFKKLETLEEDVSKMARMMLEKNRGDDVGACFKKLETLEKDISKVSRTIMEKNKEDDVGACFKKLETLEKDISIVSRTIMEKNKEDDVGPCFKKLETLEEVVSKLTRMMMEKNKQDDVGACLDKLWILEEDICKLTRMMIEKNKGDDVCACFKKLETLEKDISKVTSDVGACFKKLETLEDVSKFTRMMMEKNNEDVVGLKKLEILEQNVSKLMRIMMENNKEDDMGACIEKLDKMGWGVEEPIYETALLLFGQSADYRKLWSHLKPESCGKWVKNAGKYVWIIGLSRGKKYSTSCCHLLIRCCFV